MPRKCGSTRRAAQVGAAKEDIVCGDDTLSAVLSSSRGMLRRPPDGPSHGPVAIGTRPSESTEYPPPWPECNLAGSNAISLIASVAMSIAALPTANDIAVIETFETNQPD